MFKLSLKLHTLLPPVWVHASYVHRTHVNTLEGCYGTTTPTMLRRFTNEEVNFRTFKYEFFLKHFLSVTSRKNQNNSLISGVIFSLTRLIFFSLIESCRFWFVTSQGLWEFKKRQQFTISWIFFSSNAHKSNVQTFPKITHSFTGPLILCIVRESNPCQQLGRLLCYHNTNDAEKVYDRRDQFQNFQTWIFHYTFSECHIKKNQNYSLRSGVVFSLTRLVFFLINRKL